jgi:hypothetical protein
MMSGMTSGMSGMMPTSGGMMANGAMPSASMGMGSGMMGCHATLGVVTSSGELYVLLANQASPMGALSLCGQIGQQVTVTGSSYSRGGVRAISVSKLPK